MPTDERKKYPFQLSNPAKIFWPQDLLTKADLFRYYEEVGDILLPYLIDRPQTLKRFPNGIDDKGFYQKNVGKTLPTWFSTITLKSESEDRNITYAVAQNIESILYLANLGCIEFHPWNSRVNSIDRADYAVIDLDPGEKSSFKEVTHTARVLHDILSSIGTPHYCKTSGATGLHVYIPLGSRYTHEQVRHFSEIIVTLLWRNLPQITSLERNPEHRKDKVYLDYLQNRKGQTVIAPYSLRALPGAPVSTPLLWDEVTETLNPHKFTIKTIGERIKKVGDIWSGVVSPGVDLRGVLARLEALLRT